MKTAPLFDLNTTPLVQGASLIEASAGTGKTYTIAGLVIRLLLEHSVPIEKILVVTFTEAATEELCARIRQEIVQAREVFRSGRSESAFLRGLHATLSGRSAEMIALLERAVGGFDQASIFTIHGFCQRMLKDRAFESGALFDTELVPDQSDIQRELAGDFWRREFYETTPVRVNCALAAGLKPAAFLPLLRDWLNHPSLKLISSAGSRSFAESAAELERDFANARELWRAEEESIRGLFGSAQKWCKKEYQDDGRMAVRFAALADCFSDAGGSPTCFETIFDFTRAALQDGTRAKFQPPAHRFFELCDRLEQTQANFLTAIQVAFLDFAREELPKRKEKQKVQSFDDLINRLGRALEGAGRETLAGAVREKFSAALIDEFQDTDPTQYRIFNTIFGTPRHWLFLIGDPKQAIYGFRGADVFAYLKAAQDVCQQHTLGRNFRSEKALVAAVNTVFNSAPNPFVIPGIDFHPVAASERGEKDPFTVAGRREAPLQIWFRPRDEAGKEIKLGTAQREIPRAVAGEIARLLNGGGRLGERKLRPEDIAVLVVTNRQARWMQDALRELKIPSVQQTQASVFASEEAGEIALVLAAMSPTTREPQLKAALATRLLGFDARELETLAGDESAWQAQVENFQDCLVRWNADGFIRMFRGWLQRERVRARLLALPDGERRLTNVLHLAELLHQAAAANRLSADGLQRWLNERIHTATESEGAQPADEEQLRLERDENAVKIVTIHRSKGLEYPVVFCPFSWNHSQLRNSAHSENRVCFHETNGDFAFARDLGPEIAPAHLERAAQERLAEIVRLLYVALTRARNRCYFVWGAFNDAVTSAPAWLLYGLDGRGGKYFPEGKLLALPVDDVLRADLNKLAERARASHGSECIAIAEFPAEPGEIFRPDRPAGTTPRAREFARVIERDWRVTSFSSLSSGQREELPDHDSVAAAPAIETPATGIFEFPRGAKAGTCLHEIYERLDFAEAGTDTARALVEERLRAHGFDWEKFSPVIHETVKRTVATPLATGREPFTLATVTTGERLNEVEFYFPLKKVSPTQLANVFARHGRSDFARKIPGQIERLTFALLGGFMKGFIDLVFRQSGRFHIVDWKSNWLGNRVEEYDARAIESEMLSQHYFLQYHLYVVAMNEYLRLRVKGYDYERDFGGVYYLFLRGMDPKRPEFGIFRDCPERALVEDLGAVLLERSRGGEL